MLRTHKLGEADRVVTMLSRHHGKVRAVAKGVRKTSSKFGARLEPFTQVDLQFATGRTLDVITQAETIRAHSDPLSHDYQRYTVGQVMVETADRLVAEEGEPAPAQYSLLAGALNALAQEPADGERSPVMLMDSYLLRAMAAAGYAPTLDSCARCGAPGPHEAFNVQAGGMVCARCRPPGSARVSPALLAYLDALSTGDWAVACGTPEQVTKLASGIVAAFTSWHLDRGIRSLRLVPRHADDVPGSPVEPVETEHVCASERAMVGFDELNQRFSYEEISRW